MLNVPRITVFSEFSFSNTAELMGMRWGHGLTNYVEDNSLLEAGASAHGNKDSVCFQRYCLQFSHLPLSANEGIWHMHLYMAGWVGFVDLIILQSYVMSWDSSKSSFVLKFFSPILVLYCNVLYCIVMCHSNAVCNMAKKCCLGLGTLFTTTYLHKGYYPESTADEERSAEKSQKCSMNRKSFDLLNLLAVCFTRFSSPVSLAE